MLVFSRFEMKRIAARIVAHAAAWAKYISLPLKVNGITRLVNK
jgi:hypothetical protein